MRKMILSKEELFELIYDKLEFFSKVTTCDMRLYLMASSVFNEFQLELAGVVDFDEDIKLERLEEINQYIDDVFSSLKITYT